MYILNRTKQKLGYALVILNVYGIVTNRLKRNVEWFNEVHYNTHLRFITALL